VEFQHATLENGLEVVSELNPEAHSVAAGFFVRTGSRDEPAALSGVSHFLEHMVFKGTARRDALAVNRDLDRIGAKHNAQTSEEDTIYHLTCLPEYLPGGLEILSDILRPSLRDDDFATEKQVILEEIQMYQDNPMSVAYEEAKAAHFGPHPLGRSVLGSLGSVGALDVARMRDYHTRRYGPSNIVLAFAGRTDWPTVVELARRSCGAWSGPRAAREAVPTRGHHAFRALLREEDQQQSIVAVADAPPLESEDRYAAALLATILGDHTGSRLYWALIDPGHADGAESSYQDYNQAGASFTFLSCHPDEAQANLERLAAVCRRLDDEGPTADELAQAQNKVMARCVLRNERPFSRLMSLGFHWTYKREYLPLGAELEAYARVGVADLRRVLAAWPLWPATIASVGPTNDVRMPA
jgi:predicted Zn-dependent peptidase